MPRNFHVFPDLIFLIACVAATLALAMWGRGLLKRRWQRTSLYTLAVACIGCYGGGYLMLYFRVTKHLAVEVVTWLQGLALILGICAIGMGILGFLLRRIPFREDRRAMFRAAGAAVMSTPALITAFGIVHRDDFRVTEVQVPVKGLARGLDGLTMVQLSDIHMSEFLSERQLMRAIDMANETRAKLALVTGDLITRPGDPLDPCLRQIGRLKAEAGVFGCMGNHEGYAGVEEYVERESALMGVRFLRSASEPLRFGNVTLNLAGVDYQAFRDPYLVGAEELQRPECLNVLLSHNPDVFRVASKQGWDLTISGHTHGGQIAVEILHQNISPARYFTPFVRGLYRSDRGAVYVSTGLGTVGLPVRLGAPPEVSLIRLCAI